MPPRQLVRDHVREPLGHFMCRLAVERNVQLHTLGARGFDQRFQSKRRQVIAQQQRNATRIDDRRARPWIEIEHHLRGMVDVRRAMQKRMELDAARVGHPDQRSQIIDQHVIDD